MYEKYGPKKEQEAKTDRVFPLFIEKNFVSRVL